MEVILQAQRRSIRLLESAAQRAQGEQALQVLKTTCTVVEFSLQELKIDDPRLHQAVAMVRAFAAGTGTLQQARDAALSAQSAEEEYERIGRSPALYLASAARLLPLMVMFDQSTPGDYRVFADRAHTIMERVLLACPCTDRVAWENSIYRIINSALTGAQA